MLSCFCFPVRCCLRSAWCLASRDLTSRTTTQRCLAWINTSFPGSSRCLIQHYMTLVFSEHTHTLPVSISSVLPFLNRHVCFVQFLSNWRDRTGAVRRGRRSSAPSASQTRTRHSPTTSAAPSAAGGKCMRVSNDVITAPFACDWRGNCVNILSTQTPDFCSTTTS